MMIVEDGTGVSGANSYSGLSFAAWYLNQTNNAVTWNAGTLLQRKAALISSTQYIDLRWGPKFYGIREFLTVENPARNFVTLEDQPSEDDQLTIGDTVFSFKVSASLETEIEIGSTEAETVANMVTAINANSTVIVNASSDEGDVAVMLTVDTAGEDGNSLVCTTTNPNAISIDYPTFLGGMDPSTQPLEFPRSFLHDSRGQRISGIPLKLKQATAEYANRALTAALMPDPAYNSSGREVKRTFEKVGPIEEEVEYSVGAIVVTRAYPLADRLLNEYKPSGGGTMR